MRQRIIGFILCAIGSIAPAADSAAQSVYIPVGSAKIRKTVIAFPRVLNAGGAAAADRFGSDIAKTVENDLTFTDIFRFLPANAFPDEGVGAGVAVGSFPLSKWTGSGAEFLAKGAISVQGNTVTFEGHLYDVARSQEILNKRYIATANDVRDLAHSFADDVVERLTGLPGIFRTRITMSCDRTGKKEIYVMEYDGTNVKQITNHRSIAISPNWSPDGTKIAYSLYTRHQNNQKNLDLFEFDFEDNTIRLLSNRKGINSGATYSPDGSKIALTMSFLGNPEIFILDRKSRDATRLTRSFGFDVDPTYHPKGHKMAFVSSRTGKPMIFAMETNGTNIERLTFAGRYNATPTWSPTNNKIAFAGWKEDHFDIFIMNPDGTNIERLTKNAGNNEDPNFSPDGQFISFMSDRTGSKNIYVMNVDGTFVKRLTYGLGNCTAPRWSNPPKK